MSGGKCSLKGDLVGDTNKQQRLTLVCCQSKVQETDVNTQNWALELKQGIKYKDEPSVNLIWLTMRKKTLRKHKGRTSCTEPQLPWHQSLTELAATEHCCETIPFLRGCGIVSTKMMRRDGTSRNNMGTSGLSSSKLLWTKKNKQTKSFIMAFVHLFEIFYNLSMSLLTFVIWCKTNLC